MDKVTLLQRLSDIEWDDFEVKDEEFNQKLQLVKAGKLTSNTKIYIPYSRTGKSLGILLCAVPTFEAICR